MRSAWFAMAVWLLVAACGDDVPGAGDAQHGDADVVVDVLDGSVVDADGGHGVDAADARDVEVIEDAVDAGPDGDADAAEDAADDTAADSEDAAADGEDAADDALADSEDAAADGEDAADDALADGEDAADTRDDALSDADAAEDTAPGEDADVDPGDTSASPAIVVRIVAANITTGNYQRYEAPGIRILMGIEPDIALLQEMTYVNESTFRFHNLAGFVAGTFGPDFDWFVGDGSLPNGIVSRYPILDAGTWDDTSIPNRGYTWARVDVPGPTDLWAISVHLKASSSSSSQRVAEANELLGLLNAHVPPGDLVVLGGDFNTYSREEGAVVALGVYFVTSGPWPTDSVGDGTSAGRDHPYDWVLPDADLAPFAVPAVVGTTTWPDGLVVDTRVYTPLSDLAPAQQGDSGAPSMQHMAVIRDFAIPCPCGLAADAADCAPCAPR